jgi:hypothetical protein
MKRIYEREGKERRWREAETEGGEVGREGGRKKER